MPYGLRRDGEPTLDEIRNILSLAKEAGITYIDTATAYGSANRLIGMAGVDMSGFMVGLKISYCLSVEEYLNAIKIAAMQLGVRPTVIMAHDPKHMFTNNDFLYALNRLKVNEGWNFVSGASIYDATSDNLFGTAIQAPASIFDQRVFKNLERFKGKHIHARSVFLQGAIEMNPLPKHLELLKPKLEILDHVCEIKKCSRLEYALSFIKNNPEIDKCIVGVNNAAQLKEILEGWARTIDTSEAGSFAIDDEELIDPRKWVVQ